MHLGGVVSSEYDIKKTVTFRPVSAEAAKPSFGAPLGERSVYEAVMVTSFLRPETNESIFERHVSKRRRRCEVYKVGQRVVEVGKCDAVLRSDWLADESFPVENKFGLSSFILVKYPITFAFQEIKQFSP